MFEYYVYDGKPKLIGVQCVNGVNAHDRCTFGNLCLKFRKFLNLKKKNNNKKSN